jgi:UDP-N-acetylmuramate-alanine ligase
MAGAWEVCRRLDIDMDAFLESMKTFRGAGNRLENISRDEGSMIFRDFAHAPSKVEATVNAVREQYPGRTLYACLELHTFSSLNSNFLPQYAGSMDLADEAIVFYNPEVVKHKKLPEILPSDIREGFQRKNLIVYSDLKDLEKWYTNAIHQNGVVLMMSSGNFGGLDLQGLRLKA